MKKVKQLLFDSQKMVYVHFALVILWIILVPPTLIFWSNSIMWVLILSLWANIAAHAAGAQAAHAEKM